MTSTRQTLPIGQAVGQAEASLTRLRSWILAGSGTSHETYLGLQRLTALGGQATRDAYERDLSDWLQLDRAAAGRLAGDLPPARLPAPGGGPTRLPRRGQARREEFLPASAQIPGPMLASLDGDDLE